MITTQELYGISPKALSEMNYRQALEHKVKSAKNLLIKLLEPNFMEQDTYKINQVNKAIKFNQQLLKELE